MSPSPAISLEVSTTTTRLPRSSASTRAASRSIVVLPMPGRPRMRIDFPVSTRSSMISIVPKTARPMRQVSPTILPFRLRIAEMRCSVRSMPARLSSPNVPMWSTTYWMSRSVISRSRSMTSLSGKRASGRRPRSMTTSMSDSPSGSAWIGVEISDGSATSSASRSSVVSRRRSVWMPRRPPPAHRTPAGTSAGSATRTRVSFISSVTLASVSKPSSSSSSSIGDS